MHEHEKSSIPLHFFNAFLETRGTFFSLPLLLPYRPYL